MSTALAPLWDKTAWQREYRRKFKERHGYSSTSNENAGYLRREVLERDGYKCLQCGISEQDHMAKWRHSLTIDHINRDRSNNTMGNLQSLCKQCHGKKDHTWRGIPRTSKAVHLKAEILGLRDAGVSERKIAAQLGMTYNITRKWLQRWRNE